MTIFKQQLIKRLLQIFFVFILMFVFFVTPQNDVVFGFLHNTGGVSPIIEPIFGPGIGEPIAPQNPPIGGNTFNIGDVCNSSSKISGILSGIGNIGGKIGSNIFGNQVPVTDQKTHELLKDIDKNAEESKYLLKVLCEKEYELDVELQHGWAELIGQFVAVTEQFITEGYYGNPAFLTNQTVYYQLVDIAVARTFLQDIVDSNIGNKTKKTIIKTVIKGLFNTKFPYTGSEIFAPDDLPQNLSDEFYESGGYIAFNNLLFDSETNEGGVINLAITDLNKRRSTQLGLEQEKLAWGRGFFSYEICDLAIYNDSDEDRRNCRIGTPGALIQDQVSFVFGSALRQMEINDEYNEWIAPNTLTVLSDILSYRTLDSTDTRIFSNDIFKNTTPKSPEDLSSSVDITSSFKGNDSSNLGNFIDNSDSLLPLEFDINIKDVFNFENVNSPDIGGLQKNVFGDFLIPEEFLQ